MASDYTPAHYRPTDIETQQLRQLQTLSASVDGLLSYIQGGTTKTEVVNQLKSIGTPDIAKVVTAVNDLHATIKSHDNNELQPVLALLRDVLEQLKQPENDVAESSDQADVIDYSTRFDQLERALQLVVQAIKGQKLVAAAPVVNVPQPNITVEKVDLSKLERQLQALLSATIANTPPEPLGVDLSVLESKADETAKELVKANDKLQKLVDKPIGGGGGSGHGGSTFKDSTGNLVYPQLNADGSLPVSTSQLIAGTNYDYLDVQQTSATVETYVYKHGGALGTTVQTVTVTYTDSTKADIDVVVWS